MLRQQVLLLQLVLVDEKHAVVVHHVVDPFAVQVEKQAPAVRTGPQNVDVRVRRQDPKPFVLLLYRVHQRALLHVPNADRLVLTFSICVPIADDHVQSHVVNHAAHIVCVAVQSVVFPGLAYKIIKLLTELFYSIKKIDNINGYLKERL